jgi:5-formyltetrahydrofolate cyclo-ligase
MTASPTGAALLAAKRALRERVLAARDRQDARSHAHDSAAIASRIAAMPSFRAARCLLLTLPFGSEWDTRALLADALARHAAVVLPRVDAAARMLALHAVADVARDTAPGYRGIPEPRPDLPQVAPGDVDWVLVPGVAFDFRRRRLGYGGGYYDRLLPLLAAGVAKVAGALDLQIVDDLPAGPHDLAVDAVATPTRLLPA